MRSPGFCATNPMSWETSAPTFDTPLLTHAKNKANLVAYRNQCMEPWCPVDDG